MSFSIYTNIDALTASNNLSITNTKLSQSIQRLSSGLRINSAADDPAGSIIANLLQSQVDGITQAISNTQEASNEVKTASSGVQEISRLLNTIRTSALDAANTGASNPLAAAADQTVIQSAIQAINLISSGTQYGSKNLLDGSAGTSAAVTNGALIGGVSIGGTFNGSVTQAGNVTVTVTTLAAVANVTGTSNYASTASLLSTVNGGTLGAGGTVVLNGQSITVQGSDTVQTLIDKVNNSGAGVSASFAGGKVILTQQTTGANNKLNYSESASLITNGASQATQGTNAVVSVVATVQSGATTAAVTATFTGGVGAGTSGLQVSDNYGNSILLTPGGNAAATSNKAVAAVSANPLQFQIGANAGQTASVTFNSVNASNLGTTAVAGQSVATIDVTTVTGANNALSIVAQAQNQISTQAAQLGSFQKNVLDTTTNYLSNALTNISASVSSIRDVNVASEAVNLANLQLLQQMGASALYTAKNNSSIYLKLLG